MVKLLRLTSNDNGNFTADLEAGIELGSKSSIALQNLTFESDFIGLKTNQSNSQVSFTLDTNNNQDGIPPAQTPPSFQPLPPFTQLSSALQPAEYGKTNYKDLYANLEGALNSCLSVGVGSANNFGDVYSEFVIDGKTNPDRPEILYQYSPQTMPLFTNDGVDRDNNYLCGIANNNSLVAEESQASGGRLLGNLTQPPSGAAVANLSNYLYSQNERGTLSRGSGMYACSVYNAVNIPANPDNTHGFGIGLSFSNIEEELTGAVDTPIPDSMRDFEILIEKTDATYRYISPTVPNTEQSPSVPVMPYQYDISTHPTEQSHDRMMFERNAGVITGSIYTSEPTLVPPTAGKKHQLFSYTLTPEQRSKPLYIYAYVKGNSTQATLGRPVFTPHPILIERSLAPDDPDGWYYPNKDLDITGDQNTFDLSGGLNYFQELVSGFENVLPFINNNRFVTDLERTQKPKITINAEVLRFMGFDVTGNDGYELKSPYTNISSDGGGSFFICGFAIIGDKDLQIVNSDNYVVIIDSNPVHSYDASKFNYAAQFGDQTKYYNNMKGRRLNILATIAVNDNSGYLEWRANELVYVDFDNKFPQVLKNIKLRVLDKHLNPISVIGMAVMTLLIKDE